MLMTIPTGVKLVVPAGLSHCVRSTPALFSRTPGRRAKPSVTAQTSAPHLSASPK